MNLANLLLRAARSTPDRPALHLGTTPLYDYGTLARRAATLASALAERHRLLPGDRVGLFMSNHPAVVELLWACWWGGFAVVPINPKLHPREAHYILAHSEAALAFVTDDIGDALSALPAAPPSLREVISVERPAYGALLAGGTPGRLAPLARTGNDLAWLFYTSGTTGRPKGVMLTHRNLLTMTLCYFSDVDPIAAGDCALYAAPMSHGAGLYGLPHVAAGAGHVVPESRGFDAAEILALGRHFGAVSMFAAPTMVRRLVAQAAGLGEDGTGLKTIVYGGGPMYVEDIRHALKVLGPRFVQIYGQGESPMTITALSRAHLSDVGHPRHLARLASVGIAQTAVEVRTVNAEGRDCAADENGEVVVRGDTVMAGYWHDAEATTAALRAGWLYTGDVGSLDADGFLTLRDRSKDVIISGGSNIYPREVEEALLHHPAVAEVSVVGRADPDWGEIVVAFVVAHPGMAAPGAEQLDGVCQQHIARFKRPKGYRFVSELPKNHYGKVLKTELRAAAEAEPHGTRRETPRAKDS